MRVIRQISIKNIFYDKMDLRLFYFHVTNSVHLVSCQVFTLEHSSAFSRRLFLQKKHFIVNK